MRKALKGRQLAGARSMGTKAKTEGRGIQRYRGIAGDSSKSGTAHGMTIFQTQAGRRRNENRNSSRNTKIKSTADFSVDPHNKKKESG